MVICASPRTRLFHVCWCMYPFCYYHPLRLCMILCIGKWTPALKGTERVQHSLYSLLHLDGHSISISNLNLVGLFSTELGRRDLENYIIDWDLRLKKWHSKFNRLYLDKNVPYSLTWCTTSVAIALLGPDNDPNFLLSLSISECIGWMLEHQPEHLGKQTYFGPVQS